MKKNKHTTFILFVIYLFFIFFWLITKKSIANINGVLPYPFKVSQSMNWVPLYYSPDIILETTIINAIFKSLLFVPLGYFLPTLFSKIDNFKTYAKTILKIGFSIEFLQVYLLIGYFDITDVIYYMIGGLISYIVVRKIYFFQKLKCIK